MTISKDHVAEKPRRDTWPETQYLSVKTRSRTEQPALPCVAGRKTVIQEMKNLEIADQAPLGLIPDFDS